MKALITGMAGFIGMHTALAFLREYPQASLLGIDNLSGYYDPALKRDRLSQLGISTAQVRPGARTKSDAFPGLCFEQRDITDGPGMRALFAQEGFEVVIHLAAQPGVRYSLDNPQAYIDCNVTGFLSILEGCRHAPVRHLIYASSSSVYGGNTDMPFSEEDRVDRPASLYAATKKMNEAMAYTYAHLFGVPASGLRFFTVYGPWGRPDMSPILFCDSIAAGRPIRLFNHGDMQRDFTYVEDIVRGVVGLIPHPPVGEVPAEIYNIGNNAPVQLMDFVRTLEQAMGKQAQIEYLPMQPGDVHATWADSGKLQRTVGFAPETPLEVGIRRFVDWYRAYGA